MRTGQRRIACVVLSSCTVLLLLLQWPDASRNVVVYTDTAIREYWTPAFAALLEAQPRCVQRGDAACTPCGGSRENPCVRGCKCPAPRCVLTKGDTDCVESPFWRRSAVGRPTDGRCVWDLTSASELAPFQQEAANRSLIATSSARAAFIDADPSRLVDADPNVRRFEATTRWQFPMAGRRIITPQEALQKVCVSPPTTNQTNNDTTYRLVQKRDDVTGELVLGNVCLDPHSTALVRMVAGGPTVAYRGAFEMRHHQGSWRPITKWHAESTILASPACRYNTPVFLVPMAFPNNIMHTTHRMVPYLHYLRSRFGADFRKEVLVVYLVPNPQFRAQVSASPTYHFFYRLLSERWASMVAADPEAKDNPPPSPLCFRDLFELRLSNGRVHGATVLFAYAMAYHNRRRAIDTLHIQRMRADLGECYGVATRPYANVRAPRVLIPWRTRNRRFAGMASIVRDFAAYAQYKGVAEVSLFEHVHHSPAEVVYEYSRADVVIGWIGAGLFWSVLMPRGAVVVEMARDYGCNILATGWNASPSCDYGGNAIAAGQSHLHIPTNWSAPNSSTVYVTEYAPLSQWLDALDAALCALQGGGPQCPEVDGSIVRTPTHDVLLS